MRLLSLFIMTVLLIPAESTFAGFDFPWTAKKPKGPQTQTLFIGVDGLGYAAFTKAQEQGLFKEFTHVGAHVAPFPSMSDLSWATMMHTSELFGAEGRIKSVEAPYFDEANNSIQGDPRDYYRRLAFPKYYMGAFNSYFNPLIEALMYFPSKEVSKLEIKTVVDELIAVKDQPVFSAYIGGLDSTAHTQKDRLWPVMRQLDAELKRLMQTYKARGQELEVILASDHGNFGRFEEGKPEQELIPIDIAKVMNGYGLNFVQRLSDNNDVAMPLMALGSWGPVYVKDRSNIRPLIKSLSKEVWFDSAVFLESNTVEDKTMTVISAQGEAKVAFNKTNGKIYYYVITGNPLQIPPQYFAKALSADEAFAITSKTPYPDSLGRIVQSTTSRDFDFPDLIFNVKDGYYVQSALGAFTKMYRTHGSLSAASSFGILASNKRNIPGQIRTRDILPFLGISPKALFGETFRRDQEDGANSLTEVLKTHSLGIETDAKDLSQKRIFQHISKFVSDTRPYFVVGEIKQLLESLHFDPSKPADSQAMSPLNVDLSKFDVTSMISTQDVGTLTDAVLTAGSIEKLEQDPRIGNLKEKVSLLETTKDSGNDTPKTPVPNEEGSTAKLTQFLFPAKRAVMKMYQIPYLLEKSIVLQEKPFLPDERDLGFARTWNDHKESARTQLNKLSQLDTEPADKSTLVQRLFKETMKESDLEDRIYPTPMTKIYNEKLEDVTIVYVPGLYNNIFDTEIFSLGLNSLADDLGLRVLHPTLEGSCSSEYNAATIVAYLRNDMQTRVARGHARPKYLFISYSKGAVDTLHAFLKMPDFVSDNVLGMIAVAAPLHGSSILNVTDLPFSLVSMLTGANIPEICKTTEAASKSLTPTAMDAFWRKNERALVGLTRYFSVTFASIPEDSHIFMKATKILGQFDEDNDGVVTVSSSKFPKSMQALDLGTLKADHLAGILASNFNQQAFMKGLAALMAEIGITNADNNLTINTGIILDKVNQNAMKNETRYTLSNPHKVNIWSARSKSNWVEPVMFGNTASLNHLIIPPSNDPADLYETKVKLPASQVQYDPYSSLDVSRLPDIMSLTKVTLGTTSNLKQGIDIEFEHQHMVQFRMDHQFNYESRTPGGMDDNTMTGYAPVTYKGETWALMRSKDNSIRMTTLAYRFSPLEFPKMDLKIAVTKGVRNADPVKGGPGMDDSAFQVWFTIREGQANNDPTLVDPKNDKVFLFGYYWGDPVRGENRRPGQIFENYYSNKNVVVATLPESKELLLNDQSMLGRPINFTRNFPADLKKAFPNKRMEDLEVVAITIQHDSNDTHDSSEAYFKYLKFLPN